MKGVAGNVGAEVLQAAAEELEVVIADNQNDGYKNALGNFDAALKVVLCSLGDIFTQSEIEQSTEEQSERQAATSDSSKLQSLLVELEPHLRKRKPKQSKAVIAEIKKSARPDTLTDEIAELEVFIKGYKFKQALALLASLQTKFEIDGAESGN